MAANHSTQESQPAVSKPLPVADGARTFHRELSWLRFNTRVLEEALDQRQPMMERARFLAIVANNLDEFVMVRYASLLGQLTPKQPDSSGMDHTTALTRVRTALRDQVEEQYAAYAGLHPQLAKCGLSLVAEEDWTETERLRVETYFRQSLELTLTPLAVGPSHPFPLLGNLRLYLALSLRTETTHQARFALVGMPNNESRLFRLSEGRFALLEDVVRDRVGELFPGFEVHGAHALRVTRDGSIDIDEDQTTNLLSEIEQGLRLRGRGAPVRLEIQDSMPAPVRSWLISELDVAEEDVLAVKGPVDLTFLFDAAKLSQQLADAQFPNFTPAPCPVPWEDPFATVRQRSVMLHHPYDSFAPVVEFVQKAASDPKVLAIKQTLYRVSGDSPIVLALIDAARSGKQVTVLCELKARFDESRNIDWARRLERAGAHVLYGVMGYKVHAKLLLIVRRDDDAVRRYAHLGTGNYNDKTASVYEDLSYFTANEAVCRDVGKLFNMLTGFSRPPAWERLVVAPLTYRSTVYDWIDEEIENAKKGLPAAIFAKCNSLVDTDLCEKMYAASQAGVMIDLVIRGICIVRPGVPGLSENIRVRSVLGRYLEHSRIFRFANGDNPRYLFGSGDWMTRNFDWRVESLVQLQEPELRQYFDYLITLYLSDQRSTRVLMPDGRYQHIGLDSDAPGIQTLLMSQRRRGQSKEQERGSQTQVFVPARSPQTTQS